MQKWGIGKCHTIHQQAIHAAKDSEWTSIPKHVKQQVTDMRHDVWSKHQENLLQQGQMLQLLEEEKCDLTWRSAMYNLPRGILSFAVRASIDALPTLCNLTTWGKHTIVESIDPSLINATIYADIKCYTTNGGTIPVHTLPTTQKPDLVIYLPEQKTIHRFSYVRNLSFVVTRSANINRLYPYGIKDSRRATTTQQWMLRQERMNQHSSGASAAEKSNKRDDIRRDDVMKDLDVITRDVPSALMPVVGGLTSRRKRVPYWVATTSKTYLNWHKEHSVLQSHSDDIAAKTTSPVILVELGSGASSKTRLILEAMLKRHRALTFVPVDVSKEHIEEVGQQLERDYEGLTVEPFGGLYMEGIRHLSTRKEPKMLLFLGGSFGNICIYEQVDMMKEVRAQLTGKLGLNLDFQRGEKFFFTDGPNWSCKWSLHQIRRLAEKSGFAVEDYWTNDAEDYGVFCFTPVPSSSDRSFFESRAHVSTREDDSLLIIPVPMVFQWFLEGANNNLVIKYLGEKETLLGVMGKTDVWLYRIDVLLGLPSPSMPNMVNVGGINAREGSPLSEDLELFMQTSGSAGVVVVSFGSQAKTISMERAEVMAAAFSRLRQKVVWRYVGEKPAGLGNNTKLMSWLPQNDLLGHPKTRAFVTHAGSNGLYEALYHGVPVVCTPLAGDQPGNAARAVSKGLGVILDFHTLTSETMYQGITQVITGNSYRETAARLSRLHRDQPQPPMERAVWWIKHVIKHGGLPHLRARAVDLPWYQYYLLDVAAFLLAVCTAVLGTVWYSCSFICRKMCCKSGGKLKSQ
uniref:Histidine-specific methyltransferase SAM-dependent domain-containing protein n=1 Tax=Branchiostoma floridae TaxID=7739 RepID=C3ZNG5_BRAFL|eukprot:XP_002589907.1 hypothetical protein BRAFLDRAFT_81965 [Branchiostoma floridae]